MSETTGNFPDRLLNNSFMKFLPLPPELSQTQSDLNSLLSQKNKLGTSLHHAPFYTQSNKISGLLPPII